MLLTPEQRARLERIAAREHISVGAVIREAIERHTVPRARSREDALADLFATDAPVDDWGAMKAEIQRGAGQ